MNTVPGESSPASVHGEVMIDPMTSLLSSDHATPRGAGEITADLRHRRPLILSALLGGVGAAAGVLVVLSALVIIGWFMTGSGTFGDPSSAVRVAATLWLMAHGSGVHLNGAPVEMVPLALTFVVGLVLWRLGNRVGDSVAGHGPDAARIGDGERDWTVPAAAGIFVAGYTLAVAVVGTVATTAQSDLSIGRAVWWSAVLAATLGGSGVAVGSGRAAIWMAIVPESIRDAVGAGWLVLKVWLGCCLTLAAVSLLSGFSTATNLMSQLGTSAGESLLVTLGSLLVAPNVAAFAGAFALGPGFTVGAGTLVAPAGVVLGPLPTLPIFAALPDEGTQPAWSGWLIAVPAIAAVLAVVMYQRRRPTLRWDEGVGRGLGAGVLAGLAFGVIAHWAGGAVGPGRMSEVAPFAVESMVRAVVALGTGGAVAGAAMTWWQRRSRS